jgi:glycerol-3-phosphate acyltransferase PlsX
MTLSKKPIIAIDAMGGGNAPQAPINGAVKAASNGQADILLVGNPNDIKNELEQYDIENLPITIIPSEGKIEDNESPAIALRHKPQSSISVATNLVKSGDADGVISMGSSGATMAAAVIILGTVDGIDRPAIGGPIISSAPNQIIIDLGSNIDTKPNTLVGFGVLGSIFSQSLLGITSPKIGLLSIGSEEGKGNTQVKEAANLFNKSGLNFIGNVEGNDLITGKADIVVCDGFIGNIILKLVEGLGKSYISQLKSMLEKHIPQKQLEIILETLYSQNNITNARGGGPILGVNGISIIGHGNASANTFESAVNLCIMCLDTHLVKTMNTKIPQIMANLLI